MSDRYPPVIRSTLSLSERFLAFAYDAVQNDRTEEEEEEEESRSLMDSTTTPLLLTVGFGLERNGSADMPITKRVFVPPSRPPLRPPSLSPSLYAIRPSNRSD